MNVQPILDQVRPPADPLRWARRPKTAVAVQMIYRGAYRNPLLRSVLIELIRREGTDCQTNEARRELLRHAHLFRHLVPERVPGEEG